MIADLDPYNAAGHFDFIYGKVAETLKDDKRECDTAIGPFRKLSEAVNKFTKLDRYEYNEIQATANTINAELDQLTPYFRGDIYRDSSSPLKSTIIGSTDISGHTGALDITYLYPLAKNPPAIKALWRLGGGYDEKFWNVIGAEHVRELREIEPVKNGRYGNYTHQSREDSFSYMRARTEKWLLKKKYAFSTEPPKDIPEYVSRFDEDLFPLEEKHWFARTALEGHPESKPFADFVIAQFDKAPDDKREILIKQLDNFYSDCSDWLDGFAIDNSSKKKLPDRHPYIQLLMAKELHLDPDFKMKQILRLTDPHDLDAETTRLLFDIKPQDSIDGCTSDFFKYKKDPNIRINSLIEITGHGIDRILRERTQIKLSDPDLLKLAQIVPDNSDYDDKNHFRQESYADSIIKYRGAADTLSEKLWFGSKDDITSALKSGSLDDVASIYRFLERNNLFPSPDERLAIGNVLVEKLKDADPEKKIQVCEKMLFHRASKYDDFGSDKYVTANLSLRTEVLNVWQGELVRNYGLDDGSARYQETVSKKIDQILIHSADRDRGLLLETLADNLVIQSGLAKEIRDGLKIKRADLERAHMPIAGAEALMCVLEQDEKLRLSVIDFLTEPLSRKSLSAVISAIKVNKTVSAQLSGTEITNKDGSLNLSQKQDRTLENNLQDIHNHFGYLSVEERAVAFSGLLVPGEHRANDTLYAESYNKALHLVMNKVFPDSTGNSADAKSFVEAFLQTAEDHERAALLGGMLSVAIEQDPSQPTSLAKQVAKILAAMGPAYVKLGQAINSHPLCPPDWKEATNGLKSAAKTDPRWDLINQLETSLPESIVKNIKHIGAVLGSASFNIALPITLEEAGQIKEVVVLLQRLNAADRAKSGFEHIEASVRAWKTTFDEKYKKTILQMLNEAKEMAVEETSRLIGNKQFAISKEIYAGRQITVGKGENKTTVNIIPVDSLYDGEEKGNVRILSKAKGEHFSDLPETTTAERIVKRLIAKAYVALELSNLFSGKPFDCDRHGKQLKVVQHPDHTVDLNLYDFGGLGTEYPTDKQKAVLGKLVGAITEGYYNNKSLESVIMDAIDNAKEPEEQQYLMRVRKASLALNDFVRYLDKSDVLDVIQSAASKGVDPAIMNNIPFLPRTAVTVLKIASRLDLSRSSSKIVIGMRTDKSVEQKASPKQETPDTAKTNDVPYSPPPEDRSCFRPDRSFFSGSPRNQFH
ncbi:MAG: hypothetical protein PHS57_03945 [Alphaproteobacteria bacterium]|nr:hypothetical protein [Alphaproteobacteria bacterium]